MCTNNGYLFSTGKEEALAVVDVGGVEGGVVDGDTEASVIHPETAGVKMGHFRTSQRVLRMHIIPQSLSGHREEEDG